MNKMLTVPTELERASPRSRIARLSIAIVGQVHSTSATLTGRSWMCCASADMEAMNRLAITYADRVGAGRSAQERYHARYRAWRARTRLVWLVAMLPVPLLTLAYVSIWPLPRLFAFGVAVGSTMTFALTITLAVPDRIERWRWGAEAEKRTARALQVRAAAVPHA